MLRAFLEYASGAFFLMALVLAVGCIVKGWRQWLDFERRMRLQRRLNRKTLWANEPWR